VDETPQELVDLLFNSNVYHGNLNSFYTESRYLVIRILVKKDYFFADVNFVMMVEAHIILAIFFLSLFSMFDIIVFNEEILLTLCFLSFLFYCFNTLSDSIFSSFEDRASKFEQDLLISFGVSKDFLMQEFSTFSKLKSFVGQFNILMACLTHFLSSCLVFLSTKPSSVYFQACIAKLGEFFLVTKKFASLFQKSCVTQLLYSLILKKSSNDLAFLTKTAMPISKLSGLKSFCI
jgi:hypothetical protein